MFSLISEGFSLSTRFNSISFSGMLSLTTRNKAVCVFFAVIGASVYVLRTSQSYHRPKLTYMSSEKDNNSSEGNKKATIAERIDKNLNFARIQQEEEPDTDFTLVQGEIPDSIRMNIEEYGWKQCITLPLKSTRLNVSGLDVGIASCIGVRNAMEDMHLATEISFTIQGRKHQATLCGVFDGHGGKNAAKFVRENLGKYIVNSLEEKNENGITDQGMWDAFKSCFKKMDHDFPKNFSGTTATVVVIYNDKIWTLNVGDSRTVLIQDDKTIQLTEDARPEIGRYRRKIEKMGGEVIYDPWDEIYRVNSDLAVARAVGDKEYRCISASPKITLYPLHLINNGYLILACDGLFDVISTDQLGEVLKVMKKNGDSEQIMAKRLVHSAIKNYSQDNVSVMVIKLVN